MSQQSGFTYREDDAKRVPATRAQVPALIETKKALMKVLAQRLGLPDHFGVNWDGLEEELKPRHQDSGLSEPEGSGR